MESRSFKLLFFVLILALFGGLTGCAETNELFVLNTKSISVFDPAAQGNDAPKRTIAGLFQFGIPARMALALDDGNNELYVANVPENSVGSWVTVYNMTDAGNATPKRQLFPSISGVEPTGIALDGNELFILNNSGGFAPGALYGSSIVVYPSKWTDPNTTPIRVIAGDKTQLYFPVAIAVDIGHYELFVANSNGNITVYNTTDNGNVSPKRVIPAGNFIGVPTAIAYDPIDAQIVVANLNGVNYGTSILFYNRLADGSAGTAFPARKLHNKSLYPPILTRPMAVSVDVRNAELDVADWTDSGSMVKVFKITAHDYDKPIRILTGPTPGTQNVPSISDSAILDVHTSP